MPRSRADEHHASRLLSLLVTAASARSLKIKAYNHLLISLLQLSLRVYTPRTLTGLLYAIEASSRKFSCYVLTARRTG